MGFLDARVNPANLDTLTAAKIGAPGSATATALNATILAQTAPKLDKAEAAATYATPSSVQAQVPSLVAEAIAADDSPAQAAAAAVEAAAAGMDLLTVSAVSSPTPFVEGATYAKGDVVSRGGTLYAAKPAPVTTTTRTNRIPNPRFANNRAGWSAGTGVTVAVVGETVELTVTTERTIGTSLILLSADVPAAAGEVWSERVTVSVPSGAPASVAVRPVINQYPGPSSILGSTQTIAPGSSADVLVQAGTVAADKTGVRMVLQAGGTIPVGTVIVVSKPLLEKAATAGTYFHGGMPDTANADYAWSGAVDASASTVVTTSAEPLGTPGVSAHWGRLWKATDAETAAPIGQFAGVRAAAASGTIPRWMNRARTKVWSGLSGGVLQESTDEGVTWQAVRTWAGYSIGATRELGNGELLQVITPSTGTGPSEIWVSDGYPALGAGATWTKKIQPEVAAVRFTSAWSLFVHENIALAFEYGPKEGTTGGAVGSGEFARLLHLSIDHGKTWKEVLDLATLVTNPTNTGIHGHGVAWDKWWDRIWVTWGDDQNGTAYSDDLGVTWNLAHFSATVAGESQNVGILPMEDAILFGTDIAPNGIHRITRDQGKHSGTYTIDVAYTINNDTFRNALCQGIYQHTPDHIAFFAFGAETNPLKSCIVATRDGLSFTTIWIDQNTQPAGLGLRGVVGPTLRGNLFAEFSDPNDGGALQLVKGPAPY